MVSQYFHLKKRNFSHQRLAMWPEAEKLNSHTVFSFISWEEEGTVGKENCQPEIWAHSDIWSGIYPQQQPGGNLLPKILTYISVHIACHVCMQFIKTYAYIKKQNLSHFSIKLCRRQYDMN